MMQESQTMSDCSRDSISGMLYVSTKEKYKKDLTTRYSRDNVMTLDKL